MVVQSDAGQQRTELYPASGPLTIGRHPQCSLRLDSDLVSRQHAVVSAGHGALRVEDVSTNGTIAGDLLLRRDIVDVPYGTPIVVGDFTVFVYAVDEQGNPIGPPAHQPSTETRQRYTQAGPSGSASVAVTNGRARAHAPTTAGVPIPNMSGMNPVIAHVGGQPGPRGVHLPSRGEDERRQSEVSLRREIHKQLLEHLDLATIDAKKLDDPSMRPKVLNALRRIVANLDARIPPEMDRDALIGELADEALGLGPLERFLSDGTITEIMVVDPNTIYIEQNGKITLSQQRFTDDERVRAVIERIVTPLGRRIDESSPLVDARLKDGSRVNAVIRPIALRGSCITIRKFSKVPLTLEKLVSYGSITDRMGRFLTRCVHAKKNIVISGGTGSGKTTLLNVLSGAIPEDERIVTIEDAAELQLKQPHVVSLETRPANLEGRGEYTIRDLVKNALRMRPDRIVVGECRGGEALDMLQAMNTGHDGSLTTTHANSPVEAISRLETLVLMAGVDLPLRAIRDQISNAVHVIVQQSRLSDGTRKVTAISEVTGIDSDTSEIELRPIFEFIRTGTGPKGEVQGEYRATGYLPSFLQTFIVMGLVKKGQPYL
ncbi:MAG: Flp pilus assembly complex ATPase component TadA [Labilithrix sp.]|nr:Flp pilus assembly complex ATPase component TadA [Labilithrix sp.]MCW5815471.1 Flp pilus assembly complex ATPase component TadA [Labilithrix sp.]